VNGDRRWMSARKQTQEEILKWVNLMTLQAGDTEPIRYRKNWHTDMPSIQGPWTPFLHKNPETNLSSYPNEELGTQLDLPETASEKLIRLMKEQELNSK
jgi:large subunit ribosomal protein L43